MTTPTTTLERLTTTLVIAKQAGVSIEILPEDLEWLIHVVAFTSKSTSTIKMLAGLQLSQAKDRYEKDRMKQIIKLAEACQYVNPGRE